MAKVINLSERLSKQKPAIVIDGNTYEVNDSMTAVIRFEELLTNQSDGSSVEDIHESFVVALGEKAAHEIDIESRSFGDIKVIMFAIIAAMQDLTYEEVEDRFRTSSK